MSSILYYQNYLDNIAKSPKENYRMGLQAQIDSLWEDNTTHDIIEEEVRVGANQFETIEVKINHATEMGTTRKLGDDYRYIIYRDINHIATRGTYMKFHDESWIVTNSNEAEMTSKSVLVTRCNNRLRWIDDEDGSLCDYPCFVGYDEGSPSPQISQALNTPNNTVVVTVQGNADTLRLKANKRFIFGGRPFKLTGYNNYMEISPYSKPTILYLSMQLDEILPSDDIENAIANANDYGYKVNIIQHDFSQVRGYTTKLEAEVTLDGRVVQRKVMWRSLNENAIIDSNGLLKITGRVGEVAIIEATVGDNIRNTDTIRIQIIEELPQTQGVVIEPMVNEIKQGQSVDFKVFLYKDGIKQDVRVECVGSNAPVDNYVITRIDENIIRVKSIRRSSELLKLEFTCGSIKKEINVKLTALF